jgi:CMP-N-acetylneuraminate monooxygenase
MVNEGKEPMIDLGPEKAFDKFPAPVKVGGKSFFLVRDDSGYHLFSSVCPHQGGEVRLDNTGGLRCPQHGWRFDSDTGKGLNNFFALSEFPVKVEGDRLLASVPDFPAARISKVENSGRLDWPSVTLHSHACVEIASRKFSLLMDPWLVGPAFLGSWIQYPPPVVDVTTLRPDAIAITHEHSDHFHEATLSCFDRKTPVYAPDFPNRRIILRLEAMGFSDIRPMTFGTTYMLSDSIRLTGFEPTSYWNDAIFLVEFDGCRILNINDAGLNHRIAPLLAPVDVVMSQFSIGASGYPLTWQHLSDTEKAKIMRRSSEGKIRMLHDAMNLYEGRYLLPCASFFTLWHPSHREYLRQLKTNTLEDVVKAFEKQKGRVLDLLPGDRWEGSSGKIKRFEPAGRAEGAPQGPKRTIERSFDARVFEQYHPVSEKISREEAEAYFLRLNEVPEIVFCEDMTARVESLPESGGELLVILFEIRKGRLRILPDSPESPNVLIEIPINVLARVVRENLSWDEATIGYWCRISRSPDVYRAGFWRLLQAPYFQRPSDPTPAPGPLISSDTVLADLLEKHGDEAERILNRYGLYCTGCHHSSSESLAQGARAHGIENARVDRLVRELNRVFPPVK